MFIDVANPLNCLLNFLLAVGTTVYVCVHYLVGIGIKFAPGTETAPLAFLLLSGLFVLFVFLRRGNGGIRRILLRPAKTSLQFQHRCF